MERATTADSFAATGFASLASPTHARVSELQAFLDSCVEVSRRAYTYAMRRPGVRAALHRFARDHQLDKARSRAYADTAPTMTFTRQLVRLWRAGASYAELLRLAEVPVRAIEALAGPVPRALEHIDLEETRFDGAEDVLQTKRHIHPMSPEALREEADLCAAIVGCYRERETALRARASMLERSRGMVA